MRRWWWLGLAVVGAAGAVGVGVLALRHLETERRLRAHLQRLFDTEHARFEAQWLVERHGTLRRLAIGAPRGFGPREFLRADWVMASVRRQAGVWTPLKVSAGRPELVLERSGSATNLGALLRHLSTGDDPLPIPLGKPIPLTAMIAEPSVVVTDPPLRVEWTYLNVGEVLGSPQEELTVRRFLLQCVGTIALAASLDERVPPDWRELLTRETAIPDIDELRPKVAEFLEALRERPEGWRKVADQMLRR
jgi:hypothetical protein